MAKVQCLMKCDKVTELEIWNNKERKTDIGKEIHLTPIHTGEFFEATPYGDVKLGILNPEASKEFQVGKFYYVTFEEKIEEEKQEPTPPATPL